MYLLLPKKLPTRWFNKILMNKQCWHLKRLRRFIKIHTQTWNKLFADHYCWSVGIESAHIHTSKSFCLRRTYLLANSQSQKRYWIPKIGHSKLTIILVVGIMVLTQSPRWSTIGIIRLSYTLTFSNDHDWASEKRIITGCWCYKFILLRNSLALCKTLQWIPWQENMSKRRNP